MIRKSERTQERSSFLRLPAELRNRVSQYVFYIEPLRLASLVEDLEYAKQSKIQVPRDLFENQEFLSYTSITRVYRQTYIESRAIPFANATFIMPALNNRSGGHVWLLTRPVEQRDAVTSVIIPLTLHCHWTYEGNEFIPKLSSEESWATSSKDYSYPQNLRQATLKIDVFS